MDKLLARLERTPALRVRPRVSLITGSVLVLLTLYIPVAFDACGPNRTGLEFLRGEGLWPGMATLLQERLERIPYALGLAVAAFTLVLALAGRWRPAWLDRRWIRWPSLASGLLALFALADFFWFNVSELVSQFLEHRVGFDRPEVMMPVVDGMVIVVMLLCLRSRFLRSQRWIAWLFGLECIVCLLAMAAGILAAFDRPMMSNDAVLKLSISPAILYWIVPAGLWYRFGLSPNAERRARWSRLRPRIVLLYLPLVLFVGAVFLWPGDSRPLWGLVPYFGGLCLIFLGYTGLEHETLNRSGS